MSLSSSQNLVPIGVHFRSHSVIVDFFNKIKGLTQVLTCYQRLAPTPFFALKIAFVSRKGVEVACGCPKDGLEASIMVPIILSLEKALAEVGG
jgi:hypothetical protein